MLSYEVNADCAELNPDQVYISGIDLLGFTVDLKYGKPEENIKARLFPWQYTQGNSYIYPLFPSHVLQVPDNVYARTVTTVKTSSYVFDSADKYKEVLAAELGIGVSKSPSQSSSQASSTTSSADSSTTSAVSNKDAQAFFTADAHLTYTRTATEDRNAKLVVNKLESGLYQLQLGHVIQLNPLITSYMKQLVSSQLPDQLRFIEKYGTHYVESVIVGGTLQMNSMFSSSLNMTKDEINARAAVDFKQKFGISGSIDIGFSKQNDSFMQNVTRDLKFSGGDDSIAVRFLDPSEDLVDIYNAWQCSLVSNAIAIRIRLREISYLFDPMNMFAIMHNAVLNYTGSPDMAMDEMDVSLV